MYTHEHMNKQTVAKRYTAPPSASLKFTPQRALNAAKESLF